MGRTRIRDHRPEHSLRDDRWLNGCAQCEAEQLQAEVTRLMGVVAAVNSRCDHLGMSLRDIKAECEALREEAGLWEERARHLGWRDEHGA